MTKKTIKILGITFLLSVVAYYGYVRIAKFFAIDECLDKGGRWNYAINKCETETLSKNKITYDSKELTFVQDLLDTFNATKGKVYVELIAGDSIFRRLYIFDGSDLKYFVGDGLLTNFTDTTKANTDYFGIKFIARDKHFIEIEIADKDGRSVSDNWRIEYIATKKTFDNPYNDI